MKKLLCIAITSLALGLMPGFGQSQLPGGSIVLDASSDSKPALTKFSLDFPGGTPAQLVKAIEKATGKPLNVIISPDEKSVKAKLPPIKVTDMDVTRLFNTLRNNSQKFDEKNHDLISQQGFFTQDANPTDNSLWTFSVYERPSVLTQLDLNFPGGTPAQLVSAIEKATGKPLNVIVPNEDADIKLPPLKMEKVNVAQLFAALEQASAKTVSVNTGFSPFNKRVPSYSNFSTGYGFKTQGQPTDNSIWYFHAEKPTLPPEVPNEKICRYYLLEPYLKLGFTIDDVTTAIQTGWKMAGVNPTPELNYHKETKLLIACGEPSQLNTIEDVLKALGKSDYKLSAPIIDPATGLPLQPTNEKPVVPMIDPTTGLPLAVTNPAVENSGK